MEISRSLRTLFGATLFGILATALTGCDTVCPGCPDPSLRPCSAEECADQRLGTEDSRLVAMPVVPPHVKASWTHWRHIGIAADGQPGCPEPEGPWATQPLFTPEPEPRLDPESPAEPASIPASLARFCVYRFEGQGEVGVEDLASLYSLRGRPGSPLEALHPDSMSIARLADELRDGLTEWRAEVFLTRAGKIGSIDAVTGPLTRLAVVDTSPTNDTAPETEHSDSPHGPTLINMASQLTTDGTHALARITSRLALPFEEHSQTQPLDPDWLSGGDIGTIGNLGQAIYREVTAWQEEAGEGGLVLNLSVAWHKEYGGYERKEDGKTLAPEKMPAMARAVYRAIEYANCAGALVVAAVGNRDGSPHPYLDAGPMLPALWQEEGTPEDDRCEVVLDTGTLPPRAAQLVYAVGGVNNDDSRLFNSRAEAEPTLVAHADHAAITPDMTSPPEVSILTGSSVGAIVVSSAAAAVWTQLGGGASPDEVFQAILDSRVEPASGSRDATFGTLESGKVGRVSVCKAVNEADGSTECAEGLIGATSSSDATTFITTLLPWVDDPSHQTRSIIDLDLEAPDFLIADCRNEQTLMMHPDPEHTPEYECPHFQVLGYVAAPFVGPQPNNDPCPPCTQGSPTLNIEIDDEWEGTLSDATLKCGGEIWSLGLVDMERGDTAVITDLPASCTGGDATWISWINTLDNGDGTTTIHEAESAILVN